MARASFLLVSAGVVVAAWVSPLSPQRVDEGLDPFALGFVLLVSVSFTVAAHGLGALSRALRAALMTEPRSAEEAPPVPERLLGVPRGAGGRPSPP